MAFSDAVLAISITLLVLGIGPPTDYRNLLRSDRALAVLSRPRRHLPLHRPGLGNHHADPRSNSRRSPRGRRRGSRP
ncbi:MAG: hypothetical protein ACM3QU_13890 [Verrucomicrobiota bacterium]